jgi:hypothetical protein
MGNMVHTVLLLLFISQGWDCASELRSQTSPLLIPQIIYEYGKPRWNDTDRRKPKNSEKDVSQCHFVHHKSHMEWPASEPGPPRPYCLMSGYAYFRTDTKNQEDNCVCFESRSEAARTRSFLPCCHGPHQIHSTRRRSDLKTDRYLKTQLPSKGTNNINLSTMYSP